MFFGIDAYRLQSRHRDTGHQPCSNDQLPTIQFSIQVFWQPTFSERGCRAVSVEVILERPQIIERLDAIETRLSTVEASCPGLASAEAIAEAYMRAGAIVVENPNFRRALRETIASSITSDDLKDVYVTAVQKIVSDTDYRTAINAGIKAVITGLVPEIEKLMRFPALLNRKQAAKFLGFSEKHLSRITTQGSGPKFSGTGKNRRWEPMSLICWHREQPTDSKISPKKRRRR